MAAWPGLPEAVRCSPAAAQGLSSCAPRLRPRPAPAPPRLQPQPPPPSPPRRVAASLLHVTREQLRPESPGPRGEGRAPCPVKTTWPLPGRQRPPPQRAGPQGAGGPAGAPSPCQLRVGERDGAPPDSSGSGKRRRHVRARGGTSGPELSFERRVRAAEFRQGDKMVSSPSTHSPLPLAPTRFQPPTPSPSQQRALLDLWDRVGPE